MLGGLEALRIAGTTDDVDWREVVALFQAAGWGERDTTEIATAFARCPVRAFAFDGDTLVGVGRAIDDGRYYATIVDVVVSPAHQRRGVGRAIVAALQARLTGYLLVTLTAAPEVQGFYQRLGWQRQGTAMIWPRSAAQARAHGR
jgi:GNAT superfamily N-acetyltransferase